MIKKKSINEKKEAIVGEVERNAEEMAKSVLLDVSQTPVETPRDPFNTSTTYERATSPEFKTFSNTFNSAFSTNLYNDSKRYDGPKHKFLIRKKQSNGSPFGTRPSRKINYIQYSISPKRNFTGEKQDIEVLNFQEVRGNSVYVAKINPEPVVQVKYSKFLMYEHLPDELSHPKIWHDMKKQRPKQYSRSRKHSLTDRDYKLRYEHIPESIFARPRMHVGRPF